MTTTQDNESISEQTSRVTTVNSSNWRRTVIVIVITAIIAGTGGYLACRTIHQPTPVTELNSPETKPIRDATSAELDRKHTYYHNKGHWRVIYPETLLSPQESTDRSVVYFRGQRSTGQDPEVLYWFISVQSWELIISEEGADIVNLARTYDKRLRDPPVTFERITLPNRLEVTMFHNPVGYIGSVHAFVKQKNILVEVSTEPDATRPFVGLPAAYGEHGLREEIYDTYFQFINGLSIL